ncbi:MAG: hypothetical protein IJM43_07650 [Bacteroidaceae bacterium]|nr:hypothetical protein [Bacteroidaceae bacterium]
MEGLQFLFLLFIRLLLAYGIGCMGEKRKIGFGWAFGLSFLSPVIGLVIVLLSKKNNKVEFIDINKK